MYPEICKGMCLNMYGVLASVRQVATMQGVVSKSTVGNWIREHATSSRQHTKVTPTAIHFVQQQLLANPFLTSKQLTALIPHTLGFTMSVSSMRTCIRKAGFTYKKSRYIVCKDGLDEQRKAFATRVTCDVDPSAVISIDESSIEYESPPLRGYAKRGQRLQCKTKNFHTKKWSILMATSSKGVLNSWLIDGSINSEVFAKFVDTLQGSGFQHLMMDNASIHKTKAVLNACERAGLAPLFLPPYSPWFQPIEHCFSVLKHRMRTMPALQAHGQERMHAVAQRIAGCVATTDLGSCASFKKCWSRMRICASQK